MQKFAAALSLLFVSFAPKAHSLTVCPISEYTIAFEENEAQLDAVDLETIEASVNRARQCDVNRFELVVAGDIETEGSLAHRRAVGVRDALMGYGLPPDVIHTVNVSSERYGVSLPPAPDAVSVVIFFN